MANELDREENPSLYQAMHAPNVRNESGDFLMRRSFTSVSPRPLARFSSDLRVRSALEHGPSIGLIINGYGSQSTNCPGLLEILFGSQPRVLGDLPWKLTRSFSQMTRKMEVDDIGAASSRQHRQALGAAKTAVCPRCDREGLLAVSSRRNGELDSPVGRSEAVGAAVIRVSTQ